MKKRMSAEQRARAELPSRYRKGPIKPLGGEYPGGIKKKKPKPSAEQRRMARERRAAEARRRRKRQAFSAIGRIYWITPKAAKRICSHCGSETAAAIRPRDQRAACESCIKRLGINARQSRTPAVGDVTVRHVEPGGDWTKPTAPR